MAVDLILRLFNSQSELKCLLLERDSLIVELLVSVSGTVADSQDDTAGRDVTARCLQPLHFSVAQIKSLDTTFEPVLTTQSLDASSEITNDQRQSITAQMWSILINNRRTSAAVCKLLEYPVGVRPG